jgi:hypothetical protein
MALIRLQNAVHDGALVEQVGEPRHVERIEHIDLQEDLVSNTVPKKGHALDQCDVSDIDRLAVVWIAAVGGGERMVN